MTSIFVPLGAHVSNQDARFGSGGSISWPGTSVLFGNPGDLILRNWGPLTTYTAADGLQIVFGSYLDGTTVTGMGSGTGGNVTYYENCYCTVPPDYFNAGDPAFRDIEWFGDIALGPDPHTKTYKIHLRSGDSQVVGGEIADQAVGLNHLHPGMPHAGAFHGATVRADANGNFFWASDVARGAMIWATHDGSGDAATVVGGHVGGFFIGAAPAVTWAPGDWAYAIGGTGLFGPGGAYRLGWPNNTPSLAIVSFCNYHPGSSSTGSLSPTGGSLQTGRSYTFRYTYAKSLTLQAMINTAVITSGGTAGSTTATVGVALTGLVAGDTVRLNAGPTGAPKSSEYLTVQSVSGSTITFTTAIQNTGHATLSWGKYTQTIETMLSTPLDVTISNGSSANSLSFTIPSVPANWDGINLYAGGDIAANGPPMQQLALGTHYTVSGTTFTVTSVTSPGAYAAYGFAPWPSGTLLDKDPNAHYFDLMKWAHLSEAADGQGYYQITAYQEATTQANTRHISPDTLVPSHAVKDGAPVDGHLVTWNMTGQKFGHLDPSTLGGMSNPMTKDGSLIGGGTGGAPVELTGPVDGGGALVGGAAFYSADFQSNRSPWVKGGTNGALIYYQDGTVPAAVAMGAVNLPLVSNGPGNPPSFQGLIKLQNGSYTATLDSNGHLTIAGGSAPGLTVSNATISGTTINGNDMDFTVSFSTSAVSGTNTITFTYAAAFANANYTVQLTDWNNGAPHQVPILSLTPSTTSLQITATLAAPGNYRFDVSIRPH